MKPNVLLLFLLLFSIPIFSQQASTVHIRTTDGGKFTLYVNGKLRTRTPVDKFQFTTTALRPLVRIIFTGLVRWDINERLELDKGDCFFDVSEEETSYGFQRITGCTRDEFYSGHRETKIKIVPRFEDNHGSNEQVDVGHGKWGGVENLSDRKPFLRNGVMCASPSLNEVAFMKVKKQVSDEYLNYKKAEIAIEAIKKNCMTAEQVAALVRMINAYTSEQFDVAREGYMKMYNTMDFEKVIAEVKNKNDQEKLRDFAMNTDKPSSRPERPQPPNQNPGPIPPHTVPNGCTMSNEKFSEALQSIKSNVFEPNKLDQAKLITKSYCWSITQIREIMKSFDFENTKLEFAKYAYDKTYEKRDYYLVNQEFTFENSKTELTEYITSRQ